MTMKKTIAIATASALAAGGGSAALAAGTHHAAAKRHFLRSHPRVAKLARAVHADAVVPTKTGFATVILDRGKVTGVSGNQLTLQEGTAKATYKTVTLTIPATANVRENGKKATLADVKTGQQAAVVQMPQRTLVRARG
jgi:hypothetical protein